MINPEWFLVGWFSMFGLGWLSARFYYRHKYYPLLGYMDADHWEKIEQKLFEEMK